MEAEGLRYSTMDRRREVVCTCVCFWREGRCVCRGVKGSLIFENENIPLNAHIIQHVSKQHTIQVILIERVVPPVVVML